MALPADRHFSGVLQRARFRNTMLGRVAAGCLAACGAIGAAAEVHYVHGMKETFDVSGVRVYADSVATGFALGVGSGVLTATGVLAVPFLAVDQALSAVTGQPPWIDVYSRYVRRIHETDDARRRRLLGRLRE